MINVVRKFRSDSEIRDYQFCIPLAPNTDEGKYNSRLESFRKEGVVIKKGEAVRTLLASDMAVVASGTATLQTALLEVPMVVIYRLSPITYQLGKRIVDVKHISLVNILSGKAVVTELIQERANIEEVMKELKKIMFDTRYREEMFDNLRKVKEPFLGKNTSNRVAEMVMELAGR
jgi:lipid-A-disaccharide synthase